MPESLLNKDVEFLAWILNQRLHHGYFLYLSMNFAKLLRTPFYRTPPDDCFWYLENLTFKLLILGKFVHSFRFHDFHFIVELL